MGSDTSRMPDEVRPRVLRVVAWAGLSALAQPLTVESIGSREIFQSLSANGRDAVASLPEATLQRRRGQGGKSAKVGRWEGAKV